MSTGPTPTDASSAARTFPPGFLWGAATASYQIEGGVDEGGRGRSVWDTFSHEPGRVLGGDTGDVACDHYHRWAEDLDLLRDLGLGAYRFSVAWPRVQPDGRGPANPQGLAFYDRLVDGMLERGLEPWLTLYHWDLPQALEDAGGWPERGTAERFADYAEIVHGALGDRVHRWTTHNEPWCASLLGYSAGVHAPGRQDDAAAVRAVHHLLLGHGLAVERMRSAAHPDDRFGIVLNLQPVEPATPSGADADAVRRVDGMHNRVFLDPLFRAAYPEDVVADLAPVADLAHVRDGDLQTIARPLDFLGLNYYNPLVVGAPEGGPAHVPGPQGRGPYVGSHGVRMLDLGRPRTAMGWEVDPAGLTTILTRLQREYAVPPLYITENGAAYDDEVVEGKVHDAERVSYLRAHLAAALDAVDAGVDLRGYFAWSLLDNFEWALGYSKRFGIVRVDYDTLERTPKDSAALWASAAQVNGLPPAG
ncbi:GH1 family beta-glucosidase [Vallicoccus soli]|uniref:Beta-glucosidase n=1 Tax=Vallicoccus soli TaxID=2339232 RepID=A0A3A3ZIN5_9ACTN|nr:GH1 family beta-glucosidase [Vallicoccus soli]RJK95386.1 beta-glucosidase [Vallicoccus soli]